MRVADKMSIASLGHVAAGEIAAVVANVPEDQVARLRSELRTARYILTHGLGREGLVMRSFAMRLMHLGLPVGVVGDMTAGPSGAGTVFVCSAGPGMFASIAALMDNARHAGASIALLTAHPEAGGANMADLVVEIPAQTMMGSRKGQASEQVMGSIYEQAMWVLLDCIVWQLAQELGQTQQQMAARHTNME